MKNNKIFAIFLLIVLLTVFAVCGCATASSEDNSEFLRLHIRADSNLEADQAVKLKVRDAVIEYLTPRLAEATCAKDAEIVISESLDELTELSERILRDNGFRYGAKALIKTEKFPTKSYGDIVLESGYYRAVIINLGSGKGDNWWCVAYPPLCFIGEESAGVVKYESLIKKIIEKWRKNGKEND